MENSKLSNLKKGEMLIVSARGVKGGKVQLTFAQKITNPNLRPGSIVGMLNKSDDRFTQEAKPRFAWIAGEKSDIHAALGIDLSALAEGDTKDLNVLNPMVDGEALNIQITETTAGSDFDVANFETRAKRAGKDGDFILDSAGEYIYVKSTVVPGEAKHVFIANTVRQSQAAGAAGDAVADAIG